MKSSAPLRVFDVRSGEVYGGFKVTKIVHHVHLQHLYDQWSTESVIHENDTVYYKNLRTGKSADCLASTFARLVNDL